MSTYKIPSPPPPYTMIQVKHNTIRHVFGALLGCKTRQFSLLSFWQALEDSDFWIRAYSSVLSSVPRKVERKGSLAYGVCVCIKRQKVDKIVREGFVSEKKPKVRFSVRVLLVREKKGEGSDLEV